MWQRFTKSSQKIVFYSQLEAAYLAENFVSTEHLLLGMVRERDLPPSPDAPHTWPPPPTQRTPPRDVDHVAARPLSDLGIALPEIVAETERHLDHGPGLNGADMKLAPLAKRVIDFAYKEAQDMGVSFIGTEHLLLGMVRVEDGLAGRVLSSLGVDAARVRQNVRALSPADRPGDDQPPAPAKAEPPVTPKRLWWHWLKR